MTHEVRWYIENRVVLARISGKIGITDVAEIDSEIVSFFDEGHEPVHLILEISDLEAFPRDIWRVKQTLTYINHRAFHVSIMVGRPHSLLRFIVSTISQLSHFEVRQVETLEEALPVLVRLDSTLESLQHGESE